MDKLIDFLKNEIPSNACDLNNSINLTLEILDRTRAAVMGKINKLARSGKHDEAREFFDADEQLMNIENYLRGFIENIPIETSKEQFTNSNGIEMPINKPDYNSYKVDNTEPHYLDEDFTNKRPIGFTLEGRKYQVRNWNRLLVMICEILSKKNPNLFQSFPDDETMQGRSRKYFSHTPMKYACKKVSGTDIYVLTNNNGNGNCSIIIKMLEKYDIQTTSLEIFLRADYSPLHESDGNDEIVKKN